MLRLKEQRLRERLNGYGIDIDAAVSVRVVEARNLIPMDMNGKSDPYVVLTMGSQTHKTNFITGELNPVWNEVFTFDVESGNEIIQCEVFDKDSFG